jgi:hypothetical protein
MGNRFVLIIIMKPTIRCVLPRGVGNLLRALVLFLMLGIDTIRIA